MPQPADRARLEQALRSADSAGDTEAATQIAQAIRSLQVQQTVAATSQPGFVGPRLRDARPFGMKDAAIGAADIGISSARALVNKPAATLAALLGGINPNDTYMGALERAKEEIAKDQSLVKDDRLRTPQGQEVALIMSLLPKSPVQEGISQLLSGAGNKIQEVAGPEARDFAGSAAMIASMGAGRGINALEAAQGRRLLTAETVAQRSAVGGGSAGASAAAIDLTKASPELREAVVSAGRGGRSVSNEVLNRHVEADTLPVPIRLTAGEATQNPVLLSQERNLRGKHPEMVERMNETNKALGQNLQTIRDQIGDQVFTTNAVEHGDTFIAAYKARDAAAEAQISGLYRQLEAAGGGTVPIDARAILGNATAKLHQKLLFDHAPPEIMRTLNRLADSNTMTFENFESLRTNLARIQRSMGADGNVKAAAGVIRSELEALPMLPGSEFARLKPMADAARASAFRRFQELDADPAYEAAINGTVPPDRFVQKFVIGAPRDQLAVMSKAFANDPVVRQTMGVAVLDHLRDAARLDAGYGGNFSTAGFSRALAQLGPKSSLIFDAGTTETLGKLRNVASYTTVQPRGSFVNNSNTMVGSVAKYGSQAAEGAVNVAFGGVPVGTWAGSALRSQGTRRLIQNSLKVGAGLEKQ